jgi:hypothetical protein
MNVTDDRNFIWYELAPWVDQGFVSLSLTFHVTAPRGQTVRASVIVSTEGIWEVLVGLSNGVFSESVHGPFVSSESYVP